MKIFGLGTDIVNIKRLEKVLKKNNNTFKTRIFSKSEILYCDKKSNPFPYYAKRYAAKEALSKALGTGIRKGVNFKEHDVLKDPALKPIMIERAKGTKTVPQIFINQQHIGGGEQLFGLEQNGKLDEILSNK